jgi:hypothetical protein
MPSGENWTMAEARSDIRDVTLVGAVNFLECVFGFQWRWGIATLPLALEMGETMIFESFG